MLYLQSSFDLLIIQSFEIWNASVKRSLIAPTHSSTVLNGSVVVNFFSQNIAIYALASIVCFDMVKTNEVNMPHLYEGERLKIVAIGNVGGWTQDELKKHFNCSQSTTVSRLLSKSATEGYVKHKPCFGHPRD